MAEVKSSLAQEKQSMLALLGKMESGEVARIRKLPKAREPAQSAPNDKVDLVASAKITTNQSNQTTKKPVEPRGEKSSHINKDKTEVRNEIVKKIRKTPKTRLPRKIIEKTILITTLMPTDGTFKGETPIVALDCEMVVCSDGQKHLARVTIVNYNRHVLFDEFVKPPLAVKDYLTHITNITAFQLNNSHSLDHFLPVIQRLLANKVVVGHTIEYDFEALRMIHDNKLVRDISLFSFFRNGKFRTGLRELSRKFLSINIQEGRHSSAEDARATLELYKLYKQEIDQEFKDRYFGQGKMAIESLINKTVE